jgi:hypothetical protein
MVHRWESSGGETWPSTGVSEQRTLRFALPLQKKTAIAYLNANGIGHGYST